MGCQSGKVSSPQVPDSSAVAAKAPPVQQQTLLTSPGVGQHCFKEEMYLPSVLPTILPTRDPVQVVDQHGSSSSSAFNGKWSSGAVIWNPMIGSYDTGAVWMDGSVTRRICKVTWSDGTVSRAHIIDKTRVIEISYRQTPFTGELRDDDCIHWSDGDIWYRHEEPQEERTCLDIPRECQEEIEPVAIEALPTPIGSPTVLGSAHVTKDVVPQQSYRQAAYLVENSSCLPARKDRKDTADLDLLPAEKSDGFQITEQVGKPRKEKGACCC